MKEIVLNTIQKTSPNYRKYKALVDNEDYDTISKYRWSVEQVGRNVYAIKGVGKNRMRMHTLITGTRLIDHKDGNGLNNQKSNLRVATHQQNMMNTRPKVGSSSRFKGVRLYKRDGVYEARINYNHKAIYLGRYNSETDAALAYNQKAKQLFGEFARLNQI